ncbi:hypothetical protein BGW41_003718 [Actinomortierella wolfii]|nr:hypothetical protein BGW41_003718 [Actinomortierella wolfii]
MNRAVDPLRRLVVQLNSRLFAHAKLPPATHPPPPVGTQVLPHSTHHTHHYHHHAAAHVHPHQPVPTATIVPSKASIFGQFERKVPSLVHQDGPSLMKHLAQTHPRKFFVPEPVRVAAVNYACRSAGRPQTTSLLSQHANRQMFHQPLVWGSANSVPHAFARNVGLSASRGYCSTPIFAMNGPVKALAQMYAKPLGSLPIHAQKHQLSEKDLDKQRSARKVQRPSSDDTKPRRGRRAHKKVTQQFFVSPMAVQAFVARATQIEQQRKAAMLCSDVVMAPISDAAAISLAKVAGRTEEELEQLPKLVCSEDCPTSVDMCFLLDSSPLWHLDTMISALHTDSLRTPRVLNKEFIDELLEISSCQYQHYLEVSSILQRLVKCPEAREITLTGYELRVHFEGASLFELQKFLKALGIDPSSPNFELEEIYHDSSMEDRYFPDAATVHYYNALSMMSGEDTWDDCSSMVSGLDSSLIMTSSEYSTSQVSLDYLLSPVWEQTAWESVADLMENENGQDNEVEENVSLVSVVAPVDAEMKFEEEEKERVPPSVEMLHGAVQFEVPPVEDEMSAWAKVDSSLADEEDMVESVHQGASTSPALSLSSSQQLEEQQLPILALSSQILNSTIVGHEYFDNIRVFLDSLETLNNNPFA